MSIQRINKYYNELDQIEQYSGQTKETSIKRCFSNLLMDYAKEKNLLLVEEVKLPNLRKQPDGCLFDRYKHEFGYWEAKDLNDDLEKELQNKINIGYPTFNLLIEDSKTAFLVNVDIKEKFDMKDAKQLDKLLSKFVSFELPEVKDFREALAQFTKSVPNVVKVLEQMIVAQVKDNKDFQQKRNAFFDLCQMAINPQVTYNNIDEMLIQHILTEEIFLAVMGERQFHEENNISRTLIDIERTFFTRETKRQTLENLATYYEKIKERATKMISHEDKQDFLKSIYESFYKAYNPKNADKLGIVYTPSEIVSFMIETTDFLLEKHFDKNLSDKNVHILDPATGTGTFITDIIKYIPTQFLEYKYKNEIHANEVAILPYYIANLNIEYIYTQKMNNKYAEFTNLCFVDTLDNVASLAYAGKQTGMFGNLAENAHRIKAQNDTDISVIIGNPPYNARQQNFNDQNANRFYDEIDKRIKNTFIKYGTAQNQTTLYDMYVRFYSWAIDRIDKNGIIAFVTNRSFIDSRSFDGFRKIVQSEFDEIHIVDLQGDIRQNDYQTQGGNVFDIMTGIAIAFFVRIDTQEEKKKAKIFYHNIGNNLSGREKLQILKESEFKKLLFEKVKPDAKHNWINQTNNDFQALIPLIDKEVKAGKKEGAIFNLFSLGVATHRDEWVYDFDKKNLTNKVKYFIDIYSKTLKDNAFEDKDKIAWDSELTTYAKRKINKKFESKKIQKVMYRPFSTQYFYFDKHFNARLYQWENIYGNEGNTVIAVNREGSNKPFHCLVSDKIIDLHTTGDSQCLPLYRYENGVKVDNISDWALSLFRTNFPKVGNFREVEKVDIFHYVYGVLHSPVYRLAYEQNLKRDFPRIPLYADFWQYAVAGEGLMALHLDYDKTTPLATASPSLKVGEQMDKTTPNPSLKVGEQKTPLLPKEGLGVVVKHLPLESMLPKRKKTETDMFGNNESEKEDAALLLKLKPAVYLKKTKENIIEIDQLTSISSIPAVAWEYKLGNRSAIEWVLDQYKPYKSTDKTIQENFNSYDFADYKEEVISLLLQVIHISVETMKIVKSL